MLQSFFLPFFTIFLAEMLDKSQLAIIGFSGRTKNYLALFLGSMLAFILVDGVAILLGATISEFIPPLLVTLVSSGIFIIFGIFSLRENPKQETKKINKGSVFVSVFLLIFLSEWADKTQLAAASFAASFNPIAVFLGTITALAFITLVAIFIGRKLSQAVDKKLLQRITGVIFLLIGAFLMISVFF